MLVLFFAMGTERIVLSADDPTAPAAPVEESAGKSSGVIRVGDKINLVVFKEPDFSGKFNVESSGFFSHPIIGDVKAAGITVEELKKNILTTLSRDYITNPAVQIDVERPAPESASLVSGSVTILGQILRQGNYPLAVDGSLLKLIVQAGGFAEEAASRRVKIVRAATPGKRESLTVDVDGIINGTADDFPLLDGDIIFIEKEAQLNSAQSVAIIGQIAKPGNYPATEGLTLLKLISAAGGFTPTAAPNRVKVAKLDKQTGKYSSSQVDVGRIFDGKSEDVKLSEGDAVLVPESFF